VKEVRGAVPAPDLFSGGSALGADPVELAREVGWRGVCMYMREDSAYVNEKP
jgi:hypothetical protein